MVVHVYSLLFPTMDGYLNSVNLCLVDKWVVVRCTRVYEQGLFRDSETDIHTNIHTYKQSLRYINNQVSFSMHWGSSFEEDISICTQTQTHRCVLCKYHSQERMMAMLEKKNLV